jgi:hypothetical protein
MDGSTLEAATTTQSVPACSLPPSVISSWRTLISLQTYPDISLREFEQLFPDHKAIFAAKVLPDAEILKIRCSFPC